MKKFRLLVFLIFCHHLSTAQWVQIPGPEGGTVFSILKSGTEIFAGTENAGIFYSPINGLFWNRMSNGLPVNCQVNSIVKYNNTLFAGTTNGIFKSTNNGTSWIHAGPNIGNYNVRHLDLIDSVLFAGTTTNGIYKSVDQGNSWTLSGTGIPFSNYARAFVKMGTDLFVGTWGGGIYKSTNNGSVWTPSNNGLNSTAVLSFAIVGQNIVAGTTQGVSVSNNNGLSWVPMSSGLPAGSVFALSMMGNYLFSGTYQGIYRYDTNTGISGNWIQANNGLSPQSIYALHNDGINLYAASDQDGITVTSNFGSSWSEINTGLLNSKLYDLLIYSNYLFAGTERGLYSSTNGGNSWFKYDLGNVNTGFVSGIEASGPNLITCITAVGMAGILISSDTGSTWTTSNSGLSSNIITSMDVSGSNVIVGTSGFGTCVSNNNGNSWIASNSGMGNQTVLNVSGDGNTACAGSFNGIYTSANNGFLWSQSAVGIPLTYISAVKVKGDTIVVGTGPNGIFISQDGGQQFYPAASVIASNAKANDFILDDNKIIAGTDSGVYFSYNLGLSWIPFNSGLTTTHVTKFAADNAGVYAGTAGGSIFYYTGLLSSTPEIKSNGPLIKVYPNPVDGNDGKINFISSTPWNEAQFELINTTGQLVKNEFINPLNSSIQLNNVSPGIYVIKITDRNNSWVEKIIIK